MPLAAVSVMAKGWHALAVRADDDMALGMVLTTGDNQPLCDVAAIHLGLGLMEVPAGAIDPAVGHGGAPLPWPSAAHAKWGIGGRLRLYVPRQGQAAGGVPVAADSLSPSRRAVSTHAPTHRGGRHAPEGGRWLIRVPPGDGTALRASGAMQRGPVAACVRDGAARATAGVSRARRSPSVGPATMGHGYARGDGHSLAMVTAWRVVALAAGGGHSALG